ncbi:MAG TPA: IS66 family transposase [Terracidiphilus sp.]|jgi:transposase/predicted  nucleic acid-binding Zn-ribbon protein|nr:IS66 family transposase [Terracidiphilus sp.]
MKTRRRIDVNLEELDRVLDGAREAPLSESDHGKLKETLHALAALLVRSRNTEKISAVLENPEGSKQPKDNAPPPAGHGRNGAEAFNGARKVDIKHQKLTHGDRCPECGKGNVYGQREPKVLVRVIGQAPLAATVYSLERLRCGACGQVFTAQEPEGVGPDKYDETAAAMIAQLKYGAGTPFYRLEQLEAQMGIPLPSATQWEIVEEAAQPLKPALDELIRQSAQDDVVHNDDTGMRVLTLKRDPKDERTGVFTSGIVSVGEGRKIALYFTGSRHAGENLAEVLKKRRSELPSPIQMCDALSRNVPKLPAGAEILLANCLAHGRRQFVEVADNFPGECRYVLELLGQVYGHDAEARERGLTPDERLRLHQERSRPAMDRLHTWLEAQLDERRTEPNSGLGQAIGYLLRHWQPLTLFLRKAGAPLDNNIAERALKRAVLHRKNALFYRTLNGAQVGDLFMSLIHTCQLCGANSFDYLVELQRHARELAARPAEWMPWNYRETLARILLLPDAAEL